MTRAAAREQRTVSGLVMRAITLYIESMDERESVERDALAKTVNRVRAGERT